MAVVIPALSREPGLCFTGGRSSPPLFSYTKGIDVFQIKAVIRGSKVSERAASATDALRRFKDIQARAGVTACTIMKSGVLVAPAELLSAATVEEMRASAGI